MENPNEGVIVGLKNKDVATTNEDAHKQSDGFFVQYDPKFKLTAKKTQERDENGEAIPTNHKVIIRKQPEKGKK